MSAPVFGVTDVLALSTGWEPQSSSAASAPTHAEATGGDGDVVAETTHRIKETGTANYIYTGAETDVVAAVLAAGALPGQLVDSDTLLITSVAVDYAPCAAGQRPMFTFTFQDGPTAAPTTPFWYTSDLGAGLPTYVAANVVVPSFLSASADSAEIQTSSWSLACNFGEDMDKDGEYLAGQSYKGQETLNMQYVGGGVTFTSTGWQQTGLPAANTGANASNTGYGTSSYTFVRAVTRSTS